MQVEANIDALVGPTHHFGGLGVGNVASHQHQNQTSHPKRAALEGLSKMEFVAGLGVPQFVWLPPIRPRLDLLSQLGFAGSFQEQLEAAYHLAPRVFSAVFSSAFMWAANAATATPGADSRDGSYHFTPANLISSWHRSSEASERQGDLLTLFGALQNGKFHEPLPSIVPMRDEGAANHMRLCDPSGQQGFNVFVYGAKDDVSKVDESEIGALPRGFYPRHTLAASEAVARLHGLNPETTFFLQQSPEAIAAGVFHNDVIATSHQDLLIHHEAAFHNGEAETTRLESTFQTRVGKPLHRIQVSCQEMPLGDAVASYFFNSQIVTPGDPRNRLQSRTSDPRMVLICPQQCQTVPSAKQLIDRIIADQDNAIEEVYFVSLGESMANGGGPACLRLRVTMDIELLEALPNYLRINTESVDRLSLLIETSYPDRIEPSDFLNPDLVEQVTQAAITMRRIVMLGQDA